MFHRWQRAICIVWILWLLQKWIWGEKAERICIGDFCLDECIYKRIPPLDARNLNFHSSRLSESSLHCFLKLRRPEEQIFAKLTLANDATSFVQIFWDFPEHAILKDTKLAFLNYKRPFWMSIPKPDVYLGPKEGYINSKSGLFEKPKDSSTLFVEIFRTSDEMFILKFRNCTTQATELFSPQFIKFCNKTF